MSRAAASDPDLCFERRFPSRDRRASSAIRGASAAAVRHPNSDRDASSVVCDASAAASADRPTLSRQCNGWSCAAAAGANHHCICRDRGGVAGHADCGQAVRHLLNRLNHRRAVGCRDHGGVDRRADCGEAVSVGRRLPLRSNHLLAVGRSSSAVACRSSR